MNDPSHPAREDANSERESSQTQSQKNSLRQNNQSHQLKNDDDAAEKAFGTKTSKNFSTTPTAGADSPLHAGSSDGFEGVLMIVGNFKKRRFLIGSAMVTR